METGDFGDFLDILEYVGVERKVESCFFLLCGQIKNLVEFKREEKVVWDRK